MLRNGRKRKEGRKEENESDVDLETEEWSARVEGKRELAWNTVLVKEREEEEEEGAGKDIGQEQHNNPVC